VAAIGLEVGVWAFFAANLCLYSSIELTFSLWGQATLRMQYPNSASIPHRADLRHRWDIRFQLLFDLVSVLGVDLLASLLGWLGERVHQRLHLGLGECRVAAVARAGRRHCTFVTTSKSPSVLVS